MNAACTGCRFTCAATPSIVVTSRSRTIAASVMQASTGRPSTCTVQAPHSPRSHPFFVPVRPSRSRSVSSSVARGSSASRWSSPLTRSSTSVPVDTAIAGTVYQTTPACRRSVQLWRVIMRVMERGAISAGEFGVAFKGFLEQAAAHAPVEEPFFARRLNEHFGRDPGELPVVGQGFPSRDQPNLQRALDTFLASNDRWADLVCVVSTYKRFNGIGLADLVSKQERNGLMGSHAPGPGPVEYVDVALGDTDAITCMKSGLILVADESDQRLAVLVNSSENGVNRGQINVEAMARTREEAEAFLAELRQTVRECNVYRGRMISLEQERYQPITVRVHPTPDIERSSIILPSGVLERVERHTVEFARHAVRLREARQHIKRGLLIHGPPGTGKTLTAKYIAGHMTDRTVLIMTGASLGLVEPVCTMARLLQPATVILEDVDLIAEERTREDHACTPLLFELL